MKKKEQNFILVKDENNEYKLVPESGIMITDEGLTATSGVKGAVDNIDKEPEKSSKIIDLDKEIKKNDAKGENKMSTLTNPTVPATTATKPAATVKPVVSAAEMLSIQDSIRAQLCGYHVGPQADYDKPVNFVMASNGMFSVKKTGFGTIALKADKIPYIPEMKEGLNYDLPKVPYKFFLEAYSFFKAVSDASKDEAALILYYNKTTGEYENYCPEQKVSGASVTFDKDEEYIRRMTDPNYVRICELHSHNTMGAFHSGTDNNDEIFDCTFIVFGKLDLATPQHIFSYASSGKRVDSILWDIFERPVSRIDLGGGAVIEKEVLEPMYMVVPYPIEWHALLKKFTYGTANGIYSGSKYSTKYNEFPRDKGFYEDDYYGGYEGYGYGSYYAGLKEKEEKEEAGTQTAKTSETQLSVLGRDNKSDVQKLVSNGDGSFRSYRDIDDEIEEKSKCDLPSGLAYEEKFDADDVMFELESLYTTDQLEDIASKLLTFGYGYTAFK